MRSYLVTLETGRMILVDNAFGPGLARAAAYRAAERMGLVPNVKHVSEVSDDTAAILRRGNDGTVQL